MLELTCETTRVGDLSTVSLRAHVRLVYRAPVRVRKSSSVNNLIWVQLLKSCIFAKKEDMELIVPQLYEFFDKV